VRKVSFDSRLLRDSPGAEIGDQGRFHDMCD
jgi:hypothetical protein